MRRGRVREIQEKINGSSETGRQRPEGKRASGKAHQGEGAPVAEMRDVVNNPEDESAGTREVPFSGELWIERDDFMLDPPKKFFRLAPGREVRLRSGYFVTCT